MNKKVCYVILIVIVSQFFSCQSFFEETSDKNGKNAKSMKIKKIIQTADYDVANFQLLQSPNLYRNKIISFNGIVNTRPFLMNREDIMAVSGTYNGYRVEMMIELDHPLPKQDRIDQDVEIVSRGMQVRVFGYFLRTEEFMDEGGNKRLLPVVQCLLVYRSDDTVMKKTLWISNTL